MAAELNNVGTAGRSLCESCAHMREVVTPKGSRFLLCELSRSDPVYVKYPRQPQWSCQGYRAKEEPYDPDGQAR